MANDVERLYARGLRFLAQTQNPQGAWTDSPYGGEPAVVALAVLSFLAHGDDPNFGPYAANIRRGLEFILKRQDAKTGYIGSSMYNHGFATLALAETYGAVRDDRIGRALEKAVAVIIESQKKNPAGAWRYSPESQDADTTVSGAQMVALFAARNAGISVPQEALERGLRFFLKCRAPTGGFGYTSASDPGATRTAIAGLMFALAKLKETREFREAFDFVRRSPPDMGHAQYYLYYASQTYFHASPADWQAWNRRNIAQLKAGQAADGSWSGNYGGTFGTAASLLSLALNYRYLPIYER